MTLEFILLPVIAQYKPTDATTNPSLLYAAAQLPEYNRLFDDAIKFAKDTSGYMTWDSIGDGRGEEEGVRERSVCEGRREGGREGGRERGGGWEAEIL